MVELTQRAIEVFEIVKLVDIGALSVEEACEKLGRDERTVYRYLKRLRGQGIEGLNYCSHKAWNRSDPRMEERVLEIKRERPERSAPLICHLMKRRFGVIVCPSTAKRIVLRSKVDFRKTRCGKEPIKPYEMKRFGDMWQIDAFERKCIPNHPKIFIVMIIDDRSRAILAGMGFKCDSTPNNMLLVRVAMEGYGVPHSIKSDNDTKFAPARNRKGETELVRACRDLGCVMFPHRPFNPKSKGKIERRIPFLDEWFIKENRFEDLDDFNRKFAGFRAWFNAHFKVTTTRQAPVCLMAPSSTRRIPRDLNLDDVFCVKETRFVKRDCTVHFKGKKYMIGKEYIGEKVDIHIVEYKRKVRVWWNGRLIKRLTF